MPKKPTALKEWDTYILAEGKTSVDTLWASASILSVIRVQKKIDDVRRFAALVGHFSSPEQPILQKYLREARTRFGDAVKIIIRGGSALLMDSDPELARAELVNIQQGERSRFLRAFKAYGYEQEQMDIAWAADNQGTKIIYHARSGIAKVLTQPIDAKDVDVERLPDVF
jgi:hypothetical protein